MLLCTTHVTENFSICNSNLLQFVKMATRLPSIQCFLLDRSKSCAYNVYEN
jgi:hypothetical protein